MQLEYPLLSPLGQRLVLQSPDTAARWASTQCMSLIVHSDSDIKVGTLRKLFGCEMVENRPAELASRKPGALGGLEERVLDGLVPRDVWKRLLMCT